MFGEHVYVCCVCGGNVFVCLLHVCVKVHVCLCMHV